MCFNSGENPKLIRQSLAMNMKVFSQQKNDHLERLYGRCKLSDGTTI